MENNHAPQNPAPRPVRPVTPPRPAQPVNSRPALNGFVPRNQDVVLRPPSPPPIRASRPTGQVPALPSPHSATPSTGSHSVYTSNPAPLHPQASKPRSFDRAERELEGASDALPPSSPTRTPKEPSPTGHAGLAGWIVFVVLGALLLSPFVPGKTVQNFPLSSEGFATGEQTLDCLGTQSKITSRTAYTRRVGSPVTWLYSTNTTQSATCSGTSQSVVGGHASQFSPLALLLDAVSALVVAIVVAKLWRRMFARKHAKRERPVSR